MPLNPLEIPRFARNDGNIESVDGYADPDIEEAWRKEVGRRIKEYDEGKVEAIPAADVFAEAKRRLDEAR